MPNRAWGKFRTQDLRRKFWNRNGERHKSEGLEALERALGQLRVLFLPSHASSEHESQVWRTGSDSRTSSARPSLAAACAASGSSEAGTGLTRLRCESEGILTTSASTLADADRQRHTRREEPVPISSHFATQKNGPKQSAYLSRLDRSHQHFNSK